MLKLILQEKNMTLYQLEKLSNVPHSTLSDLYNEKTNPEKCSASVLSKLAKALDMTMDHLYKNLSYEDLDYFVFDKEFDIFKSNTCHELKRIGDKEFIKKYTDRTVINEFFTSVNYMELEYIIGMVDYLAFRNNMRFPDIFDPVRKMKFNRLVVSESTYLLIVTKQLKYSDLIKKANPFFLVHNILEEDVDNVY